jgi:hypothetical protein
MILDIPFTPTAVLLLLIILFIFFAAFLIPVIFYFLELQNTLKEVSVENRKMKPGQVWLLLIPLFSIYWLFEVVSKIADSLKAEFASRNIEVTLKVDDDNHRILYHPLKKKKVDKFKKFNISD